MKRLVSTVGLEKEEWLKYRKQGITGTDAGAIVGLNPYVSAFKIYQDKVTDEIEDIDNESMRQGRDLEAYVAKRFEEQTGKKVKRANAIYYNPQHEWMLADFDRLIVGEKAGLECKTVNAYSADKWKDGKIPLHYQLQVQHYLAVSGYECWYIAALIFGREFIVHKIERDEEMIHDLIIIEERFWKQNVLLNNPPDPDGSKNYTEMLNRRFKGNEEKSMYLLGVQDDLERRGEIDALLARLTQEKNEIDQKIKLQMQDATYGEAGAYSVSWVPYSQQRIDSVRLKKENPEIYQEYTKTISSRKFTVKYREAA